VRRWVETDRDVICNKTGIGVLKPTTGAQCVQNVSRVYNMPTMCTRSRSNVSSKHPAHPRGVPNWAIKGLNTAFDDKRITIICVLVWFVVCICGFGWLGLFQSSYMHAGPSPTLVYMGIVIDTLPRYIAVVIFVVLSTAIGDIASDAISPFIQNTVTDHKSKVLPYRKTTILIIAQSWSLYCGVMSVASISLFFSQFDLILLRLVIDLLVNNYTVTRYMRHKIYDPERYNREFFQQDELDPLESQVATETETELDTSPLNEKDSHSLPATYIV
jgi:hypothetical protein